MKPLNNHGVYDHNSPNDQKEMLKARILCVLIMIAALATLLLTALYLREIKKRDAESREIYIQELHSEIK